MKVKYVVIDESTRFEDIKHLTAFLPPERQAKTERYRFERDKLLSLAAGLLIYKETGGGELVFGEHGKPYLKDGSTFFSVSHSGCVAAIATDTSEVGCDVESIPDETRLRLADRFYHPNERDYVCSADDKPRAFCRIWTRKEAYLKMTGEGIAVDLTAFDTVSPPLSDQILTYDMDAWSLSVCSADPISSEVVDISELELKALIEFINKQK